MKKILITGHNSMIGRSLVDLLNKDELVLPNREEFDYRHLCDTDYIIRENKPEEVYMLAGVNGSISFNSTNKYDIFKDTIQIGLNTIDSCVKYGVKKVLFIVPSCALQPSDEESFEEDLKLGNPHPSVACHGVAKRVVNICGEYAREQHGLNFITVICQNSFGPHDRFDPVRGKVVSNLIKRFVDAKNNNDSEIVIWGSGKVLREFIYCKDVSKSLIQLMSDYNEAEPINLTSNFEISIKELAEKIKDIVGYEGGLVFDTSKPDGQMRKKLNSARMSKYVKIDFTDFDIALKETVDWYLENKND
jgi:GDP-L-fucose synthase